ncbi:unnamed protein product [Paramecium sonneborni]|uniref:Homogentisate 1,2-dioxygenase n=1 Tax=Paramecium sonneborni TaxID=65129 RepID=A0A8S1L9K1_9CILI|nr:unnamed protein product [Paramecium sonneborni]
MDTQRNYENLEYAIGFGNHVETEALKGAVPKGQNSPQKCAYNLIAEQFSGTAFTLPRASNQKTWLYKIRPSAAHSPFVDAPEFGKYVKNDFMNDHGLTITPNQLRWKRLPLPEKPTTFAEGLVTVCGAGDPSIKQGIAIYLYAANKSMTNSSMFNSDGDFLIVPWEGEMLITTEMGKLTVKPREICVIPRGIKFSVEMTKPIRGYICEVFKGHFKIPDLGPIGANGLANPRDFLVPVAFYENTEEEFQIINKYLGKFYKCTKKGSPYDVVGWHGNYYPYKYNLDLFNAMGTVTYDHPDPSIFTVITCQTDEPGVAVCDFAIFPPRWMVAEHTFRPPYYHRNVMSEYMGNISGAYDAKEEGFQPGYGSLHSILQGHGPDHESFTKWSNIDLQPIRYPYENLAFMFESTYMFKTCSFVMDDQVNLDHDYYHCWDKLANNKLGDKP